MKETLDLIIKCNSAQNIFQFGKIKGLEKYLSIFLLYVIQKMNINGLKLICEQIEKKLQNYNFIVDGIYRNSNNRQQMWYVEIKVTDQLNEDGKYKTINCYKKYREKYIDGDNILFICFDVSSTNVGYCILNSSCKDSIKVDFDNQIKFDWQMELQNNEQDFIKNFLYSKADDIVKFEAFFKILLARHIYQNIKGLSPIGLNKIFSESFKAKAVGVEVNYHVGHKSCIKRLNLQENIELFYNETRQADLCILSKNNVLFLIEVKMNNGNDINQDKIYNIYVDAFNRSYIQIECICDNNIIIYCSPSYKNNCKCHCKLDESKYIKGIRFIHINNAKKALKKLLQKEEKCSSIKNLSEKLSLISVDNGKYLSRDVYLYN